MSKASLIFWYIAITIFPMIIAFAAICMIRILDNFSYPIKDFQYLLAAGISGSMVLGAIILKRWYDREVVRNALKADLESVSVGLSRSLVLPSEDDRTRDGIVNITSFGDTKIFDAVINQIGLLEPSLTAKVIDTYHMLRIIVPAVCLIEGIDKINDDQLMVRASARNSFRRSIQQTKDTIDNLLRDL